MERESGYNRAATLVEMMVAVAIGILLFAIVTTIVLLARQSFEFSTTFIDIHGGARTAMDWMIRDIRWANQILSSVTIDTQAYATADNGLVLEIPSIDSSGNVITGTNDYVVYHLNTSDPTVLERIIDANVTSSRTDMTRTIAGNVNALSFSSSGTGLGSVSDVTSLTQVEVSLTTRKTASSGAVVDDSLNSAIELRNKEG
jgi:Tfp pilus assembly protein PilW